MTASYVSARFEKTDLSVAISKQRCIVRVLNDGPIPPVPGPSYFPTAPSELLSPFLLEYVNDDLGERFSRVCTVDELSTVAEQTLTRFEDLTVDFLAAGVAAGDVLNVTIAQPLEWSSEEYPGTSFQFIVASAISATEIAVLTPFPSFKANLGWSIPARTLARAASGVTRRSGPDIAFRDRRFNVLFDAVPQLDTFVVATKAGMDALSQTSTSSTLVSENYSSVPV